MAYFNDFQCQDKASIRKGGGKVIENADGSVSLFVNFGSDTLQSIPMTKSCCQKLDPNYTFDIDTQKCNWGTPSSLAGACEIQPFKVVLNPKGNDGVIFSVDEDANEDCTLDISFDYLMQFDCEDVVNKLQSAASQTDGLTPVELKTYYNKLAEYNECLGQRSRYEQILFGLEVKLQETPYIIVCEGTTSSKGAETKQYESQKTPSRYTKLGVNYNIPPRSFELEGYAGTSRYCLTDAGLLEWATILGTNTYNSWTNSNGVDTSLYGCDQVNQLIELDNNTGNLLGTCDVSITARQEIVSNINETKATLKGLDCIEPQLPSTPCSTVSDMFETLNVYMTLEMVNPSSGRLETVYEESILNIGSGNLPTYLEDNQPNTGLLSTGATGTTFCENVAKQLMTELQQALPNSGTTQIQGLVENSLDSEWLNFETSITDQSILDMIYNERIKVSLYIKDCCVDFAILIDRIKLDRNCSKVDSSSTTISKSPSFDMIRVCDNKKSWLSNEEAKHREFDLRFRDTQYDINNYKLAINSKEVDLDINPANALEQDLFCYVRDNECLLECFNTSGDCCCQGTINTLTEQTDCTCGRFEQIFHDTLNGQLSPLSGYNFTTNWFMDVTYNCGELIYTEEFYIGNGSTIEDIIPTPDAYADALSGMSDALGFEYTYSGGVVTMTEVNDCDNSYLNNNFKINLRLTICACYAPYVHDCVITSGMCDTLSGDTVVEMIISGWDFMDDAQYQPTCELLEVYGCYEDLEDQDSTFRTNRNNYVEAYNQYTTCIGVGYPHEFCIVGNEEMFEYDWYYSGLTQSEIAYSGYSLLNVNGPMRKASMNWWMDISSYSGWTETMTDCNGDPTYSANSLSDIFSGITDITTLPVVSDYADISGVTGNIGEIVTVTGTSTDYYWSPTANQWDEFGTECYDNALDEALTLRRQYRDAYFKAKNELNLSIIPFLWSNVYIPEFQVNKYIL